MRSTTQIVHRASRLFRWLIVSFVCVAGVRIEIGASSTQPTFEWVQVAAGRGAERVGTLALNGADQAFVGGSFSEVIQMDDQLRYSVAGTDVFVAKLGSDGRLLWLSTLATGLGDDCRTVVPEESGGCLVGWGVALSLLGADGTELWTREFLDAVGTFGVVQMDAGTAVALVQDTEGQFSLHQVDLEMGEDRWVKPLGMMASSARLVRDDSGNLVVAAVVRGLVEIGDQRFRLPPGNDGTVMLLKFDRDGVFQWMRFAEGAERMDLRVLKAAPGGRVILGGAASAPFTLGGRQIGRTNGVQQGWAVQLESNGLCRWQLGDQGVEVTAAGPLGADELVLSRTVLGVGTELRRIHIETGREWNVFGASAQVADVVARTNGSTWVAGRYLGTSGLGTRPFEPPIMGDDGAFVARRALIAPLVLLDPQSTTNVAGTFVRLQPEIDDADGRVRYQWYKDGKLLPGATNSTLDFPEVTLSNAGGYSVAMTNVDGGTNSAVARLSVVFSLETLASGTGRVVADPGTSPLEPGRSVVVKAFPGEGQEFVGWTGDVEGLDPMANPLNLTMNRNRRLVARFQPIPRLLSSTASDGSDRFQLVGPDGVPAVLQASEDLKTWKTVLTFLLSADPVEVGNLLPSATKTFYRLDVK